MTSQQQLLAELMLRMGKMLQFSTQCQQRVLSWPVHFLFFWRFLFFLAAACWPVTGAGRGRSERQVAKPKFSSLLELYFKGVTIVVAKLSSERSLDQV
jgi:hypothetical protein